MKPRSSQKLEIDMSNGETLRGWKAYLYVLMISPILLPLMIVVYFNARGLKAGETKTIRIGKKNLTIRKRPRPAF